MSQSSFDFTPGLTTQFKSLRQVTAASVYTARGGLNATAADCDISPSELTRMVNRGQADQRALDLDVFESILVSTKDLRPIHYLVEKYLQDPERIRANALQQLAQLTPIVAELVRQAGASAAPTKRR